MVTEGSKLEGVAARMLANETSAEEDLSWHGIGPEGALIVAEALVANRTVHKLGLYGNGIKAEGCAALGMALRHNRTLRSLDVSCNYLFGEGCTLISEGLRGNSTLLELYSSHNNIGSEAWRLVGDGLVLQNLYLSNNSIRVEGSRLLGEVLRSNNTLRILDLSCNEIRSKGCTALSEALKVNCTLTTLDLRGNCIDNESALPISEILHENTTLQHLNISGNGITSEGCRLIGRALGGNSVLLSLNLRHNHSIRAAGHSFLSEGIRLNRTLQSLHVGHDDLNPRDLMILAEALRVNVSLRKLQFDYSVLALQQHYKDFAFSLGSAVRDCPRHHALQFEGWNGHPSNLLGPLVHEALELPVEAKEWTDYVTVTYFHECHIRKVLAFAMGQHARLGGSSVVRHLNEHAFDMVLAECFGVGSYA